MLNLIFEIRKLINDFWNNNYEKFKIFEIVEFIDSFNNF